MLKKRSFSIAGHRTSVALEQEFWSVLEAVVMRDRISMSALVAKIDSGRGGTPLASALRLHALDAIGSGLTYDPDTRLSGEER